MFFLPKFDGPFCDLLPDYIKFMRASGYDFGKTIVYKLLAMNRHFLENRVSEVEITEDIYMSWIRRKDGEKTSNQQRRYIAIHGFAKYLLDNGHSKIFDMENPIRNIPRFVPYIYSDAEMTRILQTVDTMHFLREHFYEHSRMLPIVLRLLYSTGMRISEVLDLKWNDVNLETGDILVLDSKNHDSRMITVSESMRIVLNDYNNASSLHPKFCYLFSGAAGEKYTYATVLRKFRDILKKAQVFRRIEGHYPRLHDLRHSFCIRALEQMQRKGYDLYTALPILSKYLGHQSIVETEYYIRLTSSAFVEITDAVATYAPNLMPGVEVDDHEN